MTASPTRRFGSMVLVALVAFVALVASGVLEIRMSCRGNAANAIDLFGDDEDEERVVKAEPFWNEGSGTEPIIPRGVPAGFADLAERVSPGVVNIQTSKTVHGMQMPRSFEEFFRLDRYPQAKVIEKTCEPLDTSDETPLHESFYGCFQGYPFRWFIVLSDGRVTHCCYDAHGQQCIGDLKEQTVEEILESVTLEKWMSAFKSRDWETLPRCGECFKHSEGKPPFYDQLIQIGHRLDRVIPLKPLVRRLVNR